MALSLAASVILCTFLATHGARLAPLRDDFEQVQSSEDKFLACKSVCYHDVRKGGSTKDGEQDLQCKYGATKLVGHAVWNPISAATETAGALWDGAKWYNPFGGVGTLLNFCNIACFPRWQANDGTCDELPTFELQGLVDEFDERGDAAHIHDLFDEDPVPGDGNSEDDYVPEPFSPKMMHVPFAESAAGEEIQQGTVLETAEGEAVVVKMLLPDGLVVQSLDSDGADGKLVKNDGMKVLPKDDPRVVAQDAKKKALVLACQDMGREGPLSDGSQTCFDQVKDEADTTKRHNKADGCCLNFAQKYMSEKKVGFMSAYCLKLCLGQV